MRSKGADEAIILTPPKEMTLDFVLEYVGSDELVEVTPKSLRIRKKFFPPWTAKKIRREEKKWSANT